MAPRIMTEPARLLPRRPFAPDQTTTAIVIAVPVISVIILTVLITLFFRWTKLRRANKVRGQYSDLRDGNWQKSNHQRTSTSTTTASLSTQLSPQSMTELEKSWLTVPQLTSLPQYTAVDPSSGLVPNSHLQRKNSATSEYSLQCGGRFYARFSPNSNSDELAKLQVSKIARGPSTRVANYHSAEEYSNLVQNDLEAHLSEDFDVLPTVPRRPSRRECAVNVVEPMEASIKKIDR